jgi:hypothetical protein
MPHRVLKPALAEGVVWLLEQAGQVPEVALPVVA